MPAPYENDPDRRQFARLLKWFRETRGLSREELGAVIGFSAATIKSVELLHRSGTLYMAKRLDPALNAGGAFEYQANQFKKDGYSPPSVRSRITRVRRPNSTCSSTLSFPACCRRGPTHER